MTVALDRFALMQTFVRIAETGNLTAAARSLGLSQPSVSRQLKQLEALLNTRLARRTTHELALTQEGESFLKDCRRLLDDWDGLAERIGSGQAQPRGLLRAVVPVGLGQSLLVDFAARFQQRYPEVRLDWILTDAPVDLVALGADCQVRAGPIEDERLVVRRLCAFRRVLVAAPALLDDPEPASWPNALARLPAVALRPFYGARLTLLDREGQALSVPLKVAFAADNIMAVQRAARAALGFALLPYWLVAEDLAAGRLVRIAPQLEGRPTVISLGYPTDRYRPARLTLFIAMLREELAGLAEVPSATC